MALVETLLRARQSKLNGMVELKIASLNLIRKSPGLRGAQRSLETIESAALVAGKKIRARVSRAVNVTIVSWNRASLRLERVRAGQGSQILFLAWNAPRARIRM